MDCKSRLAPILAVGGHLKNSIAISQSNNIFISQHIGDLETSESFRAFNHVIEDFKRLYEIAPQIVVCDKHLDYISTKFAYAQGLPVKEVQHHHAHITACMLENEVAEEVLGIAWDGTGYGDDGTVWGGEFLLSDYQGYKRVGHFRTFPLPGGEKAVKEPRRSAVGVLYEIFGKEAFEMTNLFPLQAFTLKELSNLAIALDKRINSPRTSSAGRLFDALASLLNIRQINAFEGQGAMELEFLTHNSTSNDFYECPIAEKPLIFDWKPMILAILRDIEKGIDFKLISLKFHNTLVEVIVKIADAVGREKVVLSGGCFQNRYLTERAIERLRRSGFHPYWHQRIPPNDGGIALGQIVVAEWNVD
jgi:hydrogenase maturation protein HypF